MRSLERTTRYWLVVLWCVCMYVCVCMCVCVCVSIGLTQSHLHSVPLHSPLASMFCLPPQEREKEYDQYLLEKMISAKKDFKQLLKEVRMITHTSQKMMKDSDRHLKDIVEVLKVGRLAVGADLHSRCSLWGARVQPLKLCDSATMLHVFSKIVQLCATSMDVGYFSLYSLWCTSYALL